MLGTMENAETAWLLYDRVYSTGNYDGGGLEGWDFIGSGVHRFAWLGPDNVVYKVGSNEANTSEYRQARILTVLGLPDGFGVPDMYVWSVEDRLIIAAEYLGGDADIEYGTPEYDDYIRIMEKHSLNKVFRSKDFHGGNIRYYNGKVYAIDLGFGDTNYYDDVSFTVEELERCRQAGLDV
jgi:uncharacterized short protein YbdD (DUF466 family)